MNMYLCPSLIFCYQNQSIGEGQVVTDVVLRKTKAKLEENKKIKDCF